MNGKVRTGLVAAALALVAVWAVPAAAQTAPTLTATANGLQVTINWNDIPGALGYQLEAGTTPGSSNIAAVPLPASTGRPIVITAPPGTYYLRVRGLAVGIVGPASNEVALVVGGAGGCSTMPAPSLTSSVNGPAASFAWSAVPGNVGQIIQFGTAPGRTDLAQQLSSTVTSFGQNVPFTGTFYARVVAANACGQTVTSNEVAFTIANLCGTQNPVLTANVTGGTVTFNWTGVAGPSGLALEFSRFPGQTEASQGVPASAGSHQQHIPLVGTLYARLVVSTPCGVSRSPEVSFTITNPNIGSGPRTPDPPPGQLLPVPGYGEAVVNAVAAQFPGDMANACNSRTIVYRMLRELRRRDTRWGLNWKRGHIGSESTDIVTYNPTNLPDEGNGQVYLFDVVFSICERNLPAFFNVTHETWAARGDPLCAPNTYCTRWTLQPYLAAGFPPDEKD